MNPHPETADELVVLLDDALRPAGTAAKTEVHTDHTPLHLAFSCYVRNAEGELLLTRRALGKVAWPGVWTNSFCGHPGPGEEFQAAVERRAHQELGLDAEPFSQITGVIPDYQYRAVDASGVVEWEFCPVFVAELREGAKLRPEPAEVADYRWIRPVDLVRAVESAPFAFSPWLADQLSRPALRRALGAGSAEGAADARA